MFGNFSKDDIRKKILAERKKLSAKEVQKRSEKVFETFLKTKHHILPSTFCTVGLYCSLFDEVQMQRFFEYFRDLGISCAYPKMRDNVLDFYTIENLTQLQPGKFKILEPQPTSGQQPVFPEVVFVPGVAFTGDGTRLGFGKGFYDHTIATWPVVSKFIGVGFSFQILPNLPAESYDQKMHFVLSEV